VLTVNGQKVYLRDVASFHTADTQTHQLNNAARALNSGLSGHDGSIQFNKNGVEKSVPVQRAMNAYSENAGIYD
jgi:hypothetical protein